MLSLNTFFKPRFGYFTLIGAMVFGALTAAYLYQQQQTSPAVNPKLAELAAQNNNLNNSLAKAIMALDIERKTITEMNSTLLTLQSESLEQQLALRFYQKVMAPEFTANGVHIEKVILEPGISPRHIRVEVLIAQLEKRKRYIKGEVLLEVIGSLNGKPEIVNVSSLIKSSKDLKLSFRFFQHIKSEFELPEYFLPEYFKVIIKMPKQRGQKSANVSQEYPWNELVKSPIAPMFPITY